jgi:hypothetical protein
MIDQAEQALNSVLPSLFKILGIFLMIFFGGAIYSAVRGSTQKSTEED